MKTRRRKMTRLRFSMIDLLKSKAAGGGRQTLAAVGSPAVFNCGHRRSSERKEDLSHKNILKFTTSC